MALKGHTKIELTNVNTGEVEIYEDDNMVTNALENYFQTLGSFGCYSNLVSSQSLSNFVRRFTNGLFLFDKPLEERVDNLLPPGGTQLTGRGSTLVYDGVDKTMGSYSTQSKPLYNGYGYEHVWEFNTNQANGKIASACLTTALGGKVGTGVEAVDTSLANLNTNFETPFKSNQYYKRVDGTNQFIVQINMDENYCLYVKDFGLYGNYCQYFIHSNASSARFAQSNTYVTQAHINNSILNTHDLILYKYRVPFNNLSLFEYEHNPSLIETKTIHLNELDTIITTQMKTLTSSAPYYYYNYHIVTKNDYMYFYFHPFSSNSLTDFSNIYNKTENGNHGYIWKINLHTFQVEKFFEIKNIVTNQKNGIGLLRGSFRPDYNYSTVASHTLLHITENDYLIIPATFNNNGTTIIGLCKIDLNNQTDFEWIHWCTGPEDVPHTWNGLYYMNMFDYNDKMYVCNSQNYYIDCLDLVDNSNYFITANNDLMYEGKKRYQNVFLYNYNDNLFLIQQYIQTESLMYTCFSILPNMLVTINNLPQEIIKSPEQTMKVTYTIVDDNYVTD